MTAGRSDKARIVIAAGSVLAALTVLSALLLVGGGGVEREDQLESLRSMGCELVEGYLTGRPQVTAALAQPAYSDGN